MIYDDLTHEFFNVVGTISRYNIIMFPESLFVIRQGVTRFVCSINSGDTYTRQGTGLLLVQLITCHLWPLLLTWINFNPNMD